MEFHYKRSMNESYMVVKGDEIQKEETYQTKMLLRNQVKGLLPCKIQKVNGEKLYYYQVTGVQSLQTLFENRKFDRQDLETLFISVLRIMESLDEYLMNRDCLLLQPSCIFQNKENNTYSFLWIPLCEGNIEIEFRQLTEYILPKINHTDKNAVTLGYGVYKEAMESHMRIEFLKKQIYMQKEEVLQEEYVPIKEISREEIDRERILDQFYAEEEEKETGIIKRFWLFIKNLGCFQGKKRTKEMEKKSVITRKEEKTYDVYPHEVGTGVGATVLLKEEGGISYLEEIDQEYSKKYYLEKETIIVGKWNEQVDIWLDIPTISRLHAKIILKNKEHYLIDLNSRNGTMINNIWLDPEREYLLHDKDILIFAQKKFRYVSDHVI